MDKAKGGALRYNKVRQSRKVWEGQGACLMACVYGLRQDTRNTEQREGEADR